jgi:hypothetical protein
MAAFMGRHDDRLDERAGEWVRAGIVSSDQAEAIVRFEHEPERPAGRLTLDAEVASYLGSALALLGGLLVVERRWEQLGLGGRLGLATTIALVGFVAGTWLVRLGESGTVRLGAFLWMVGTAGVAMSVAVVSDQVVDEPGWVLVAVGAVVAGIGGALWGNRARPLQLVTLAAGVVLVLSGVGELVRIPIWVGSAALLVTGGLVAVAGASGRLLPRDLATAIGAASAFVGALSLSEIDRRIGSFVALAVAAMLLAFAIVAHRVVLLVLGLLGTLVATQALLMTTFSGALASMAVAIIGLAVVVGAVLVSLQPDHDVDGSGARPDTA